MDSKKIPVDIDAVEVNVPDFTETLKSHLIDSRLDTLKSIRRDREILWSEWRKKEDLIKSILESINDSYHDNQCIIEESKNSDRIELQLPDYEFSFSKTKGKCVQKGASFVLELDFSGLIRFYFISPAIEELNIESQITQLGHEIVAADITYDVVSEFYSEFLKLLIEWEETY